VRGGASFEHLEALAHETAEWNWHMVLHLKHSIELVDLAPRLRKIANPFVVDHLGHVLGDEGMGAPALQTLLELLDTDRCWVKLASLYRSSSKPYPHEDMLPMIHKIAEARPDRIIWGTNWPHPIHTGPMPNDGDIVDLVPLWVPDADRQRQMLVDNPARLYGF
jgi:predicted TIM-barrel fold metal-dependent hydrolase